MALGAAQGRGLAAPVPDLFGGGRLVAYRSRLDGPPGPMALRADATELHRRGFRAITTPVGSRAVGPVCRLFKRHGFRTVLIDVPDPGDQAAVGRALRLRRCADGYVIGNGGLAARRYSRAVLEAVMARVRARTGKPVATREPVERYEADAGLLSFGDWVFPSAPPYDADAKLPQVACGWSVHRYLDLVARVGPERRVVLGETGLPTAGEPALGENGQRAFFACVETRAIRFEYYTAFDDPARTDSPVAAHYGLFRADGTPKALAISLARPGIGMRVRRGRVGGLVRNVAGENFRVALYARAERWEPRGLVGISRRGKWKARVDAAAALLVARSFVPGDVADRLPQVDGARVFAISLAHVAP